MNFGALAALERKVILDDFDETLLFRGDEISNVGGPASSSRGNLKLPKGESLRATILGGTVLSGAYSNMHRYGRLMSGTGSAPTV
jgi:hypothetical protein